MLIPSKNFYLGLYAQLCKTETPRTDFLHFNFILGAAAVDTLVLLVINISFFDNSIDIATFIKRHKLLLILGTILLNYLFFRVTGFYEKITEEYERLDSVQEKVVKLILFVVVVIIFSLLIIIPNWM